MTVEELIEQLSEIEDKSKKIVLDIYDDGNLEEFNIFEYEDVVQLEQN